MGQDTEVSALFKLYSTVQANVHLQYRLCK